MKFRDLGLSYESALHGVQSATMHEQENLQSDSGSPKHLRVGVNSAMSDLSALAQLLMDKGIFTEDEYIEMVRLAMNEELARHEDMHKPIKFR